MTTQIQNQKLFHHQLFAKTQTKRGFLVVSLSLVLLSFIFIGLGVTNSDYQLGLVTILLALGTFSIGVILLFAAIVRGVKSVVTQSQFLASERLNKAESLAKRQPDKAKPAWDIALARLEQYFERNLNQNDAIFRVSIGVMIVGFVLIIFGIGIGFWQQNNTIIAGIAAVAGVITEFIGAMFLYFYRATVLQASKFTKSLEKINSVGMALQVLDTVSVQHLEDTSVEAKHQMLTAKIGVAQMILTQYGSHEAESTR